MSEENLSSWEKSNISDHFELLIGGTPKRDNQNYWDIAKETENRWVSIKDIKGRYLFETEERISELGIRESNVKLIPEDTVIMSFKLTIGRLSITKRPLYTNEAIVSFIPKRANLVDTNYLYYGLQSWNLLEEVDQAVKGATLNKDKMSRIVGLFPSLPEQRKIATILTSVDEVIENTRKQIEKLQDLKKAVMNELLTKGIGHTEFKDSELGKIPKSWSVVPISGLAFIDRESLNSSTSPDYEFFYIDIASVKTCFIDMPSTKIKYGYSPSRARKIVRKGDVLLSTVRPNLKAFAYVENDCLDWVCSTGFSVLSPKDGNDGRFIFYSVLSEFVTKQIEALVVGSNYPAINSTDVKSLLVLRPSLSEQKKIASTLNSIDICIKDKQQKLYKTQSLKKSLMQDLLTGKIRAKVN